MRVMRIVLGFGLIAICLASRSLAVSMNFTSARAAAMGNAFMATESEPTAIFTQPAGLAENPAKILLTYGKPLTDIPGVDIWSGNLAVAIPAGYGTVGLGFSQFQVEGLLREQSGVAAYGAELLPGWNAGLAIKYLYHDYLIGDQDQAGIPDPVFQKGTAKGVFSWDMGMTVRLLSDLRMGLALRNLNQPDWGLTAEDQVRMEGQAGLWYEMTGWGLRATADVLWKNTEGMSAVDRFNAALGVEQVIVKETLVLRAGANLDEITAGFGLSWSAWTVDYAYALNMSLMSDSLGSHKIALTYRPWEISGKPASENRTALPKVKRTKSATGTSISAPRTRY